MKKTAIHIGGGTQSILDIIKQDNQIGKNYLASAIVQMWCNRPQEAIKKDTLILVQTAKKIREQATGTTEWGRPNKTK